MNKVKLFIMYWKCISPDGSAMNATATLNNLITSKM